MKKYFFLNIHIVSASQSYHKIMCPAIASIILLFSNKSAISPFIFLHQFLSRSTNLFTISVSSLELGHKLMNDVLFVATIEQTKAAVRSHTIPISIYSGFVSRDGIWLSRVYFCDSTVKTALCSSALFRLAQRGSQDFYSGGARKRISISGGEHTMTFTRCNNEILIFFWGHIQSHCFFVPLSAPQLHHSTRLVPASICQRWCKEQMKTKTRLYLDSHDVNSLSSEK